MVRCSNNKPNAAIQIRDPRLLPWMKAFARWLLSPSHKKYPTVSQQTAKAHELCGTPFHARLLSKLKGRADFQTYLAQLEGSVEAMAKETLVADYNLYVEMHRRGVELALEAKDYKSMPAYTTPILDRVIPRKQEAVVHRPSITINVSDTVAKRLLTTQAEDIIEATDVELVEDDASD